MLLHVHDHISLPVTEGSKMRSNMPITGCWPIRHTLRARKYTTRQIHTIRRGGHVPKAPPVRVLSGCTLTSCLRARPAPLTRLAAPGTTVERRHPALEDFGQEEPLVRAGPSGSSPTVPTLPLARRHRHHDETFTVSELLSWPIPTAADRRAQRGEAAAAGEKLGSTPIAMLNFPRR